MVFVITGDIDTPSRVHQSQLGGFNFAEKEVQNTPRLGII